MVEIGEMIERSRVLVKWNDFFHEDEVNGFEHRMMGVLYEVCSLLDCKKHNLRAKRDFYKRGNRIINFYKFIDDTLEDVMARIVIRILGMCAWKGVVPARRDDMRDEWEGDFGGFTFAEQCYALVQCLVGMLDDGDVSLEDHFGCALCYVECWASHLGIDDLWWYVEERLRYEGA